MVNMNKKYVAIIIAIAIVFSCCLIPSGSVRAEEDGAFNYEYECRVLELINEYRAEAGLVALGMDERLFNTARLRAKETTVKFDHTRPDGTSCFTAFPDYFGSMGENIAYGQKTPEEVVEAWMKSPGHKANIMNSDYRSIGIGCYSYNGRLYWSQCFCSVEPTGTLGSWKQSGDKWWFENLDGSYPYNGWKQIAGQWYYFDSEGWMVTGWRNLGENWYYLNSDGVMTTGWLNDGGAWYYFDSEGVMTTGWVDDGDSWYYLDSDGNLAKGWRNLGENWYYFHSDGEMVTGWLNDGGSWYYFNTEGSMITGWLIDGVTVYYFDNNGEMVTGWLNMDGDWYYFYDTGAMARNTVIDGCAIGINGLWMQWMDIKG